jgi:hypothetical protein
MVITALGGGHLLMMRSRVKPPATTEFGLGPRLSAGHLYTATLTPAEPLRPRKMQAVRVTVLDGHGEAVEGAQISVDGGMPQHGHGLPTRPRVTRAPGNGVYEIEGVRFNMGGWWEFKLSISSAAGTDVVTFNLDL